MTRDEITHLATERGAMTASADQTRRLAAHTLRLMDRIEGELCSHTEAVRAGMEAARSRGIHVGRPMVHIDMERVAALWAEGYSPKAIAKATGYCRSTITRRLASAGYVRGTAE